MPLFYLSETKVKDGIHIMTEGEIAAGIVELSDMLDHPVRDGKSLYPDILRLYAKLDANCYAAEYVFFEQNGSVASGYNMAKNDNPCPRLTLGMDIGFRYNTYQMEYLRNTSREKLNMEASAFRGAYPKDDLGDIVNARGNITEKVYHPEKAWESYFGGVMWFYIWFLMKIKQRGFCLKWEILTLRYPLMGVFWPGTFWFYPGDPLEQAREIRRWCGYVFSALISFFGFGAAGAGGLPRVSAGGSIQSGYVYGNNKLATEGWVIQPWIEASLSSGWYIGSWGSFGLENHQGNEIDYTIGKRLAWEGVDLDISYNYYQFMDEWDGMHAPNITACVRKLSLCGNFKYLIPNTNDAPGMQFGIRWAHQWPQWYDATLRVGIIHTRDVFGRKPITVLKPEVSVPLFETGAQVFVQGYLPLVGGQEDGSDKGVRVLLGINYAF